MMMNFKETLYRQFVINLFSECENVFHYIIFKSALALLFVCKRNKVFNKIFVLKCHFHYVSYTVKTVAMRVHITRILLAIHSLQLKVKTMLIDPYPM